MSTFHVFAAAVHERFNQMSKHELFVTTMPRDEVWAKYLAAFPEGTNLVYKTHTEHDCSCCRHFVKNIGNVVSLVGGNLQSIWNVPGLPYPYDKVATTMNALICAQNIEGVFRSSERGYGAKESKQLLEDGGVKRWNHFHATVAPTHFTQNVDQVRGDFNTTAQVFARGLAELSPQAVQDVLSLIDGKSLYRGEEHLPALQEFAKMQLEFKAGPSKNFAWANLNSRAARFRNTVIGTLVQDLSAGVDLETAVKSFELKVAPANYKRPTALITPRMVEAAMKTIEELDLQDSLQRRFAKISDVSVNDVLWVDNSVKGQMKGGIADTLMAVATAPQPDWTKAEDISIDDFMAKVLPKARSIDMFVKNTHTGNFMSLTAPDRDTAAPLFKWDNGFAWSYDGNVTDSIRERVKNAGGNVNARLRFSLAWSNHDDLDIHVETPDKEHIYFGNKRGILDVDMNAGHGTTRSPVENMSFTTPRDGVYRIRVHQFAKRETDNTGLTIEVASDAGIQQYSYNKPIPHQAFIDVGTFTVKGGRIVDTLMGKGFVGGGVPMLKWGIKTETAVKVQTIMLSPNYWEGSSKTGNKHTLFILEGCKNDLPTRGIYNEFLHPRFEEHRKVFEVLGDKTKCPVVDEQLSGLGFSSTKRESVTVQVKGDKLNKLYNINF